MGIHPTHAEKGSLSDVALARDLVTDIAGQSWRGVDDMIERVYRAVSAQNQNWTRRRVRAIWNQEAAAIKFHEMRELFEAASNAKRLEEARRDHAAFINKTASLLSLLEHQDAAFHSAHIAALGGAAR